MLYWYPKIKDLDIPQPKTEIMEINTDREKWVEFVDGKTIPFNLQELKKICNKFGYPVFVRTDNASGKHNWKNTCFIDNENKLLPNLSGIIEFSLMADIMGLAIDAIVVREYIPMKTLFTAFWGDMPVNPEIRFFVNNGKILCWHWYWVEEAIENPSDNEWKIKLENAKKEVLNYELEQLKRYAETVAKCLDGYWSIDFCKAEDGRWILIDLAEGLKSWHPENCEMRLKSDVQT